MYPDLQIQKVFRSSGFKYTKMLKKNYEFLGAEGFFWGTARSFTYKDKQGTHEPLSLKKPKKTAADHSGNNTVLRIKRMYILNGVIFINSTNIFSCGLHVNIFYVKYLIQVSTK